MTSYAPREVDGFPGLRVIRADNPSHLTLDGTRTHVVGRERCVVIDPGPADSGHLDRVAAALAGAEAATIALTHDHPDHAEGAAGLAERLVTAGLEDAGRVLALADGTLEDAHTLDTDVGRLVALATPGHTRDHASFYWPGAGVVFCGDLMTGGLDTALVASPEGHLGDYLASLERLRALSPRAIFPAHGPPFADSPEGAIATYLEHRRSRLAQVREALAAGLSEPADVVALVYGDSLPGALLGPATAAVMAYLEHLESAP
ncbi:MAG: MBL fold metallo-hydrolase [Gemmatimonadota bacterium]